MKSFIYKIDHWFAEFFHKMYVWGGDGMTCVMKGISYIAEMGILFLLIGLVLALFKRTRKGGITILIAVGIGFVFTNLILKNVIARARPFEDLGSDFYKWWLDAGANYVDGFSFPSGHTTATTAFSVAIFLSIRKKYSWPILFLPLLMASSRIYLGVHYFTDCVGGLVVGSLSAVLAYLIAKRIYCSEVKLSVWIRHLNIFNLTETKENVAKEIAELDKKKAVVNNSAVKTVDNPEKAQVEDFVYITQAEEQDAGKEKSGEKQDKQ